MKAVLSSTILFMLRTRQLLTAVIRRAPYVSGTANESAGSAHSGQQTSNPPTSANLPDIIVESEGKTICTISNKRDGSLWPFRDPSQQKVAYDPVEVLCSQTCNGELSIDVFCLRYLSLHETDLPWGGACMQEQKHGLLALLTYGFVAPVGTEVGLDFVEFVLSVVTQGAKQAIGCDSAFQLDAPDVDGLVIMSAAFRVLTF